MATGVPMGTPPGWGTPYGWTPMGNVPTPQTREIDLRALASLKIAMVIALVSTALGFFIPEIYGSSLFTFPTVGSTSGVTLSYSVAYVILGSVAVGIVLTIISLVYLRSGFLHLRQVDRRFQTSPTWVILLMVGVVLLGIGLGLLLSALVQFLACVGTSTIVPSNCGVLGGLLAGLAVLAVGAIVGLIGGIGTVIAVWRLGDRYNDGLFKAGAILFIFVSFIGAILVLIATVRAEGKVRSPPIAGGFVAGPGWMPPPPAMPPVPPPPSN